MATSHHLKEIVNIVQRTTTIDKIISKYSSYPGVQKIKTQFPPNKDFELAYISAKNINQIIKLLNVNKAKDPDEFSAKFVKMPARHY